MKAYVALLLASLSPLALAQEFPEHLICQSVGDCIAGHPNFCEASTYFPATVDHPADFVGENYDPSGVLTDAELASKVKIDFTDGDQYSFYFFNAEDMTALANGTLTQIQGTYEDGFDWVNGYNTRAKFNITCEIPAEKR